MLGYVVVSADRGDFSCAACGGTVTPVRARNRGIPRRPGTSSADNRAAAARTNSSAAAAPRRRRRVDNRYPSNVSRVPGSRFFEFRERKFFTERVKWPAYTLKFSGIVIRKRSHYSSYYGDSFVYSPRCRFGRVF